MVQGKLFSRLCSDLILAMNGDILGWYTIFWCAALG